MSIAEIDSVKPLTVEIYKILHNLGLPAHIKGYQYISFGLEILFDKPNMKRLNIGYLYKEIADEFNTTKSNVERSIRHAIDTSFHRGDIKLIDSFFGHSLDLNKAKPTNFEYIITIYDNLFINL